MLEKIVSSLEGRPTGDGFLCRCPAHADAKQSLKVSERDGKLLLFCHAGCSFTEVRDALKNMGLMPEIKRTQLRAVNSKIEAIYRYVNAEGELLFEKIRKSGKQFYSRRKVDGAYIYKNVVKGFEPPLYRLPEVIKADIIFLCEGEKDADNVNEALSGAGWNIRATCNYDGAGKWRSSYTKVLTGKTVYIVEDNDEPGRRHTEIVGRALLPHAMGVKVIRFPELPEKGDISDFLETGKPNEMLSEAVKRATPFTPSAEVLEAEPPPTDQKFTRARYSDYIELFVRELKTPQVDIFTEKLMTLDRGHWQPARNYLGKLKSIAANIEDETGLRFHRAIIEDHLEHYESQLEPRFLVDVPPWDGRDRVSEFCESVILSEHTDITAADFQEFMREWLSKAWEKLTDPMVQNRIVILKGGQGIGKDTWIDSLLAGAGQFLCNMNVVAGDKDTFLQLHRGLFLKISEFDKTARTEVSLLKDLLTAPYTDLRAQYERDFKRRYVRCSFISSCNVDDILRDYTGSRRYLVFECDRILWQYPRGADHGLQVLAQARELAKGRYRASGAAEKAMATYLAEKSPEDPAAVAVQTFAELLERKVQNAEILLRQEWESKGWVPNSECHDVVYETGKLCGLKPRQVRMALKNAGKGIKSGAVRGFSLTDSIGTLGTDEDTSF